MKISLAGLLLVIFVVLKLTGNIAWSWFWVLSPIWMSFTLYAGVWAILTAAIYFGVGRFKAFSMSKNE